MTLNTDAHAHKHTGLSVHILAHEYTFMHFNSYTSTDHFTLISTRHAHTHINTLLSDKTDTPSRTLVASGPGSDVSPAVVWLRAPCVCVSGVTVVVM